MKTTRMSQALLVAVIGSAALIGCKKKEEAVVTPPVTTAPEPASALPAVTPTASVIAVNLGNAVGPDQKVTTATTTFAPADTIHAAVDTQTSDAASSVTGTLGAKWTHVDSNQVVHEESKDFTFAGPGTTTFQISKPDGWPTGRYKVEVSLDGSVVNTSEFEVK